MKDQVLASSPKLLASSPVTRFISRHIFDLPLNETEDDDLVKVGEQMHMSTVETMIKDNEEAIEHERRGMRVKMGHERKVLRAAEETFNRKKNHPTLRQARDDCVMTKIIVPTTYDVEVYVYTPKKLENNKKNAALIHAHGGGAVGLSAADVKNWRANFAVKCGVVLFDVECHMAPETKYPNNVKDFYAVIKHISENSYSLGIDSQRIGIAGESGGGYICFGAMLMLAQNDESDLVKMAMPDMPMQGELVQSDPLSLTKEEREISFMMRKIWRMIPFYQIYPYMIPLECDRQKEDSLIFRVKAGDDELLAKIPPTVIIEAEFDMFINEADCMSDRLQAAGKLLEYVVIPGLKHASNYDPSFKSFSTVIDVRRIAIKEYLLS